MVEKRRWLIILSIVIGGLLVFLGWRTVVFCYSQDFPENFELVVSRCRDAEIIDLAPNGEHIVIKANIPKQEYWLINDRPQEKIILPDLVGASIDQYVFVTDSLLLGRGEQTFIWELASQQSHPLEVLNISRDELGWIDILTSVERIYYLEPVNYGVAIIPTKAPGEAPTYFLIDTQEFRGQRYEIKEILIENEIAFELVISSDRACGSITRNEGCASHNEELIAGNSGVLTSAGEPITSIQQSELPIREETSIRGFAGWTYDDRGLFFEFGHAYLFENGWVFWLPDIGKIPGGVGILKLPMP